MKYCELTELMGVRKFTNMTSSQVIKYLRDTFGIGDVSILGSGACGVAIKIANNVYKMWMLDSAYGDFVKFCQANPNNPTLPRMLSGIKRIPAFFLRHQSAPNYINYVKIEQLQPVDYTQFRFIIQNTSVSAIDVVSLFDTCRRSDDIHADIVLRLNRRAEFVDQELLTVDDFSSDLKSFIDALIGIYKIRRIGGHELDFHSGNFMARGDQLVIIDPLYNEDDLDMNDTFLTFNNQVMKFLANASPITKDI
jgi:hypothetical protein